MSCCSQRHQARALGQLALHVVVAQRGEAFDEGIRREEVLFRLGEQIALHVAGATFQGEVQLGFGLDALGDDPAAGLLGHLRQRLDHLATGPAARGFLEQAHVELEDVRLQGEYAIQLRVACAEVVNGDACAGFAIAPHHVRQAQAGAAQFGDLEDDALRRNAARTQLLEAGQRLAGAQPADPARRNVDAEEPVRRHFVQTTQGVVAYLAVESAQRAGGDFRVNEEGADRQRGTVFLAQPAERFDTSDQARGGVYERLEKCDCLPVYHGRILDLRNGDNSKAW